MTSGALPLAVGVAALAGLVSFASPVRAAARARLPRLRHRPDGRAARAAVPRPDGARRAAVRPRLHRRLRLGSIFVTTAGRALVEHRTLLMRVGGVLVILMGLVFLGVGEPARGEDPLAPARRSRRSAPCSGRSSPSAGRPAPAPRSPRCSSGHRHRRPAGRGAAWCSRPPTASGWACRSCSSRPGSTAPAGRRAWLRRHQRTIQVVGGVMLVVVGRAAAHRRLGGPQPVAPDRARQRLPGVRCERRGTDVAQPRLGLGGWLRWTWRQLTSMRTALFLLLLLAIGAIPGSTFPQR